MSVGYKHYTGVGSRKTPKHVLGEILLLAKRLDDDGWTLRSGGADGADTAFEDGVTSLRKEIFLPWKGFNNNPSQLYTICEEALKIAEQFHPAWFACSMPARKLMARNVYQVLGKDLKTPSKFVICWTPDIFASKGGTSQAVRIARAHDIPVYNMRVDDDVEDLGVLYYKRIRTLFRE